MDKQNRLELFNNADIYPVTCEEMSEGRDNIRVLEDVLAGGAKIVQLREKDWSKKRLYQVALEFKKRTQNHGALLMVNDHVDVALASGADGVHLGRSDLPLPAARKIAPELVLGASSHSLDQALEAQKAGADYVNIGPLFSTPTKEENTPLGVEAISTIAPGLDIPFTVMGGITMENISQVLDAGAQRIAMVSGITRAPDIKERVRELREMILQYRL